MRCCVAGTNGCLDLRCRAFALDGRVSAKWSKCPGFMARRTKRQCGSNATKLSRLDACEAWKVVRWCRMQASSHNSQGVVDGGVDEAVWALRHQTGAQYSAVECTKARVAIRRVVAPAPQREPASRLRSATHDVSFLRSDSRRRRYVSDLKYVLSTMAEKFLQLKLNFLH